MQGIDQTRMEATSRYRTGEMILTALTTAGNYDGSSGLVGSCPGLDWRIMDRVLSIHIHW